MMTGVMRGTKPGCFAFVAYFYTTFDPCLACQYSNTLGAWCLFCLSVFVITAMVYTLGSP
jgi:hypothetical protein